ncbi:MAG: extracellular solute-binding protein [Alphaproteobacteria bacterium]|nr:extracellular solute-binding protein [Alphaproteobacteria bacterium]
MGTRDVNGAGRPHTKRVTKTLGRRRFLKTAAATAGVAAFSIGRRAHAADEITVFTWETYHEPPWVEAYTAKTGVKVNIVNTGSVDEMYSKTRSGAIEADLILVDSGSVSRYVKAGLLAPFDAAKVANVGNITASLDWKGINSVDGQLYGVPYNWGTQPLMYHTEKVTPAPDSWGVLWDPKYKGQVNMFDDSYVTFPMIALYVGAKDPFNLTDAEFEKCREALLALRPQIRTIAKGFDDATSIYGAGDAVVGYCQNIAVVTDLVERGLPFAYTFPKEGTPSWVDNFVVTERGNRQASYDFCSECLSLGWQKQFVEFSANNGILSLDNARAAAINEDILKNTNVIDQTAPGFFDKLVFFLPPEDFDRRLEIWNEFKAGG